jgi:hypothetical protein
MKRRKGRKGEKEGRKAGRKRVPAAEIWKRTREVRGRKDEKENEGGKRKEG